MKVAVSTWSDRVSPVLDVAGQLLLVETKSGAEVGRREVTLEETDLGARARHITDLAPDVLICGAVSRPLEAMLTGAGIRLRPHTCGSVAEVLQAFLNGQLDERAFLMPGCCERRRRCRGGGRQRGRMQGAKQHESGSNFAGHRP